MRRVAIIQARTSSSRLPGKVLESVNGIPMIVFMLKRVARARLLDHFVVATSVEKSDDVLAKLVAQHGFDCYRGSLEDVLGRFSAAAEQYNADVVVRLTGDCPLIDADVIDRSISVLVDGNFDYVSNADPPTFPNGLDVESFTRDALSQAEASTQLAIDREHVTPYIRRNKTLFRHANMRSYVDMSALRWTVDHPDDLAFVRALTAIVDCDDVVLADRFAFLRALEAHGTEMPRNVHPRNERFSEAWLRPERPKEAEIKF
jgi:spore coat polysaccharide biosynthesis protein SpsF (cytidylyltransferase family)